MPRKSVPAPSISPAADADIVEMLQWSVDRFGDAAAERYENLLIQSIHDIAEDPNRPGSKQWPLSTVPGIRTYHLSFSRDRVPGPRVNRPRHFLLYRIRTDGVIEIARILHDGRDLQRHVPEEFRPRQ